MTIALVTSEVLRAEADRAKELKEAQAELQGALEHAKGLRELPPSQRTLADLRERAERAQYNYDRVKAEADTERNALPTPETARALVTTLIGTHEQDFAAVEAAGAALNEAYQAFVTSVQNYNKNVQQNVSALENAGIPERDVKLDGKRISRNFNNFGMGFQYDGTTVNYINVWPFQYDANLKHIFTEAE